MNQLGFVKINPARYKKPWGTKDFEEEQERRKLEKSKVFDAVRERKMGSEEAIQKIRELNSWTEWEQTRLKLSEQIVENDNV